jgi:PleD family two-component response regulator
MEWMRQLGISPVVLIVDDNELNREVVAELVGSSMECDIGLAAGGPEALKFMEETAPDLVLLDVNMPGMDGYAVCRAIRSGDANWEIPVIFLTGQRDSEFIVKGFEAGGSDYLLKPFESRELLARVRVHLELKLQRDELRKRNSELEAALARVKRLEGIIPICMYCKKIRNDDTMWQRFEQYIEEHSDAFFSHGLCPDCFNEQLSRIEAMKDDEGS